MNLKNKIMKMDGQQLYFLGGKPTDIPNRIIYLSCTLDDKHEYSLWNVEFEDDDDHFAFWPYEGEDTQALILELAQFFVEHAFDKN